MKKRDQIEDKYKINIKDLYDSEDAFLKEIEYINKYMTKINKFKNHILDTSNNLYKVLSLDREISMILEKLYIYAHINNDFDLSNEKGNIYYGKIINLYNKYDSLSSYIIPELLKENYSKIKEYLKENNELNEFKENLKEIYRTKKHVLSEKEESLLTNIKDSFRSNENIYSTLSDVDLKFKQIKDENGKDIDLNVHNYSIYLESNNRKVRKDAFESIYDTYKNFNSTFANILSYEVRNKNNLAKIRKYSSALEMSLESNNIDVKIYDNLIKSVHKNLNIAHEQWKLKKELLGLDEIHIYDTYTSSFKSVNKKYSFEEARDLIQTALLVMGGEYSSLINKAFSEKWIDVFPSLNKRTGGYCTCAYLTHPYIFVNYQEKLEDVSTLIHELGHAMHYYYAKENNTYNNYNYSIFVAEVASQVNELLLSKYLLNKSNDINEKLYLWDKFLSRFKATIIRQTMFAEFERDIHVLDQKGTILTKEVLNERFYKLNKEYYGNEIVVDEEIKYEWEKMPHLYYDFYVYQYATGFAAAIEIANNIYNKKKGALDNYLKFLSLGSKVDPVESLRVAGVDITNKKVYQNAFKEYQKVMDEIKKI